MNNLISRLRAGASRVGGAIARGARRVGRAIGIRSGRTRSGNE